MKKALITFLVIVSLAFGWHLLLWSNWKGSNFALNPVTDVAVVKMIGPSAFGITDPQQAAAFEGMRDLTGIPIGEHKLNNYARQYLDLYAMVLPYRISITNRDEQSVEISHSPTAPPSPAVQSSDNLTPESEEDSFTNSKQHSGFKTYTNSRYGFAIDFPQSFLLQRLPDNGDGAEMDSPDGRARLVIAGGNNSGLTAKQYYELAIKDVTGDLGYHTSGSSWFVVTSTNGNELQYQKAFVGDRSHDTFTFTYPADQKELYGAVVTVMEKSFRPGDTDHAH